MRSTAARWPAIADKFVNFVKVSGSVMLKLVEYIYSLLNEVGYIKKCFERGRIHHTMIWMRSNTSGHIFKEVEYVIELFERGRIHHAAFLKEVEYIIQFVERGRISWKQFKHRYNFNYIYSGVDDIYKFYENLAKKNNFMKVQKMGTSIEKRKILGKML